MKLFKKKAVDSKKQWELYFNAIKKQEWQKALGSLNILKEADPENPNVYLRIGDTLQRTGKSAESIASYHEAGARLMKNGFSQKALAVYKVILRLDPNDDTALRSSNHILSELESYKVPAPTQPEIKEEVVVEVPEKRDETEISSWQMLETPHTYEQTEKELPQLQIPAIFSDFTEEDFNKIIEMAELKTYEDGETVVEEGDTGDSIYIVKSGNVKVIAHILGKTVELAELKDGDVFGEVAFLTGRPRTASIIADGRLNIIELNRLLIEDIIEKNPSVLERLQDFYHLRVQETIKKVKERPKG